MMPEYEVSQDYEEITQDVGDLQQRESEKDDVKIYVCVDEIKDPVRAWILPHRDLVMSNVIVVDGPAVHVIADDLRRGKLTIMALAAAGDTNTNIRFATTKEEIENGGGILWPARPPGSSSGPPLEIHSTKGIWAKMEANDAATVTVSYIAEYWAE